MGGNGGGIKKDERRKREMCESGELGRDVEEEKGGVGGAGV